MQKPRAQSSSTSLSRRRWTAEDARQALAALARSGLGLSAFAIREGLDPQRLTRWRRQLASSASPRFEEVMPVVTRATVNGDAVAGVERERFEVVLPSGRIVRVPESFDAGALRRLLDVVDGVRAC
jgi:transposase-like protein